MAAYAGGARDITIAPGTYVLPATGRSAVELVSWKSARIQARGVTIVFEELAHRPVYLRDCENVTLEGAVLRFATPAFTQGRIVAMGCDDRGDYLDWQIDAGYPANLDPVKSTFDVADQSTRLIKAGTGDVGFHEGEPLGDGRFRLRKSHGRLDPTAIGDWLFTRIKPCEPIVQLDRCGRCTMRDVTLQNAGFAAFFETGGDGGHIYVGCRVAPGPRPVGATEDQLVGCGADGFHSAGVRSGPTLDRCTWEGLLHDDCIAIHGSLQQVEQVEGNKLVLAKGNRGGFVVGEPVRMSSKDGFFGEFTCTALRTLGDGRLELTLDRASGAPVDSKASNPRCNGTGFRIVNCTLGDTRSRGILVKADHGLIEGCTIRGCGMSAISIGPEYYWNEADYARKVTIRNNTLAQNVLNGSAVGTIYVHGDGAIGNAEITIAENHFERNYGQTTIHVAYADSVRIANNRFVTSPLPLPGKARTVLHFETTRNITLKDNTVEDPGAQDTLVSLGESVESLAGNDATGICATTTK
ncbi:MAG: right-handed parallel beta-helix repeat-containing protein [Pirellulaceae bacterium]|nr:right-handed parallel beta-helix repeat-containing protein [Pirellulaceae bacterium]